MVAHACNPSTGRLRQEDRYRFEASLSYLVRLSNLVRPCFQIKYLFKPGVVVHACNPSIWEAETGGSRFEDSLSYLVRLSAT